GVQVRQGGLAGRADPGRGRIPAAAAGRAGSRPRGGAGGRGLSSAAGQTACVDAPVVGSLVVVPAPVSPPSELPVVGAADSLVAGAVVPVSVSAGSGVVPVVLGSEVVSAPVD